jgi:hypothetical protein
VWSVMAVLALPAKTLFSQIRQISRQIDRFMKICGERLCVQFYAAPVTLSTTAYFNGFW